MAMQFRVRGPSFPEGSFGGGAAAPSWMAALTLNAWTAAGSSNTFQSVQAADVGQYATTGPDTVFTSSCGAVLIPEVGDHGSILHCGAGHLDYYGNEVYRFDLSSRVWSRINEPTDEADWSLTFTNGLLADGKPFMPHTYYWLTARAGKLVLGVRQVTDGPTYTAQVAIFDPIAETWTTSTATPTGVPSSFDARPTVYDASRDLLWLVEPDVLSWASYDFVADAWTSYDSAASAYQSGNCAVYVPTKDAVILFPGTGTSVIGLDPANPTDPGNNETTLTTTGTGPTLTEASMAHWSENLGAIVYYPSRSNDLYTLTPPAGDWKTGTWAWAQLTLTGTTGVHDGTAGTYGKFNVIDYDDGSVFATVIGDVDGDYQVAKLQEAA